MDYRVNRKAATVMAIAVAASMSVAAASLAADTTAAAWTDDVVFSATATAGKWGAPNNTSEVLIPGPNTTIKNVEWFSPDTLSHGHNETCVYFEVEGTTSEPKPWSVTVRMQGAPFYGSSSLWNAAPWKISGKETVDPQFSSVEEDIQITGRWMNGKERSQSQIGDVIPVGFCGNLGAPPRPIPVESYVATQTVSEAWTTQQACVKLTVAANFSHENYPFWYGWETTLDLSEAYAHFLDTGGTANALHWSPFPTGETDFTATEIPGQPHVFTLRSGYSTALRHDSTVTINACVKGQQK